MKKLGIWFFVKFMIDFWHNRTFQTRKTNAMKATLLSEQGAENLAAQYIQGEEKTIYLQELLNSGIIPRLKGYVVQTGKVQDLIRGGKGQFDMKLKNWESYKTHLEGESDLQFEVSNPFIKIEKGEEIEYITLSFENPPLELPDGSPIIIFVRTDRISTHDISRGRIPFKDTVNAIFHNYMRKLVAPVLPHAQIDVGLPDTSVVTVQYDLERLDIENVFRDCAAVTTTSTSLYVHYFKQGKEEFCGIKLPDNLEPNGKLPYIMATPSTKSGSDESVSPQHFFDNGILTQEEYWTIHNQGLAAFGAVYAHLWKNGIIMPDTKIEHGRKDGKIVSIDELFTMDSSRYWRIKVWQNYVGVHKTVPSFSKEFAREFSKGTDGYTDDERIKISGKYLTGTQEVLGIVPGTSFESWPTRVETDIKSALSYLDIAA